MPWKPHLSLSSRCWPLKMPACSKQVPVLCLSLEGHSWQGYAHQQRQRRQNMGRVRKKRSVLGAEGRTSERRADAGMTYWHKMAEAPRSSGVALRVPLIFPCPSVVRSVSPRSESLPAHCMTLAQPRQGHSVQQIRGMPFPCPWVAQGGPGIAMWWAQGVMCGLKCL